MGYKNFFCGCVEVYIQNVLATQICAAGYQSKILGKSPVHYIVNEWMCFDIVQQGAIPEKKRFGLTFEVVIGQFKNHWCVRTPLHCSGLYQAAPCIAFYFIY